MHCALLKSHRTSRKLDWFETKLREENKPWDNIYTTGTRGQELDTGIRYQWYLAKQYRESLKLYLLWLTVILCLLAYPSFWFVFSLNCGKHDYVQMNFHDLQWSSYWQNVNFSQNCHKLHITKINKRTNTKIKQNTNKQTSKNVIENLF